MVYIFIALQSCKNLILNRIFFRIDDSTDVIATHFIPGICGAVSPYIVSMQGIHNLREEWEKILEQGLKSYLTF